MVIIIIKEDTGLEDYFDFDDNLLTKAMDRKGYTNTYVNGNELNGTKTYLWGLIKIRKEIYINPVINNAVKQLSDFKKNKDTTIDLG